MNSDRRSIFIEFERFQAGSRDRSKNLLLQEVWPAMSAVVRDLRQEGYDAVIEEYLIDRPNPALEMIIQGAEAMTPLNLVFRHSYGGLLEVYENCAHASALPDGLCSPSETLSPIEVAHSRVAEICWRFAASAVEQV